MGLPQQIAAPTLSPTEKSRRLMISAPTLPTNAPTQLPTNEPNLPTHMLFWHFTSFPTSAPTSFPTTSAPTLPTTSAPTLPTNAPTQLPTNEPNLAGQVQPAVALPPWRRNWRIWYRGNPAFSGRGRCC